jgi:intracellular multiplication protein IcmP
MSKQQQGGGGGGGGGDNSMSPVWITMLLFFALYFIWYYFHQEIVSFIFKINLVQAKFFNFILANPALTKQIYIMETVDPATVTWDQLILLTQGVGNFTRYPVIVILVVMAVMLYLSNITLKFRRSHNMKTLRAQEQYNWPAIMPVIKEDLAAQDINKGPWAMALSPMEFARKYNLLKKDDLILDNPVPGQEMTAGVRRGDAKRVFTLQLGPYWDGFERCSPQAQAIAAMCMARMNRDRDAASLILTTLDRTFATGKPDFSIAKATLKKYKDTELVQEILPKHAYLLTMMASLLAASRNDGVVPTSEFLWLKVIDRRLWYMLNCVGRQTPYAEVAGPFAHWLAEKAMGRRSLVPMIDEAIKALEIAIKEIKLSPRQMQELEP